MKNKIKCPITYYQSSLRVLTKQTIYINRQHLHSPIYSRVLKVNKRHLIHLLMLN